VVGTFKLAGAGQGGPRLAASAQAARMQPSAGKVLSLVR
jgi:hypothetical protein